MSVLSACKKEIEAIVIASIAGLLGCLMRTCRCRRRVRWSYVALETAASGFVGYLSLRLCQAMTLEEAWIGVVVGLSGWAGAASTLAVVERIVYRRLGVLDDVAADKSAPRDTSSEG